MSPEVPLLVAVLLLAHGIAAGVMVSTVIGIVPLTLTLPYDGYVRMVQFLWPRYDPFMPACNSLALLLDLLLVVRAPSPADRLLPGLAAALLAAVIAISLARNVPLNRYVMSLDPDAAPQDWTLRDPRTRWRDWNRLRTALALLALAVNAAAGATLL